MQLMQNLLYANYANYAMKLCKLCNCKLWNQMQMHIIMQFTTMKWNYANYANYGLRCEMLKHAKVMQIV